MVVDRRSAAGYIELAPHVGALAETGQVVVMRRYLVVANQTLQRSELRDELRRRIDAGPSSFFVLVPNTRAADYLDAPAAAAFGLQPSMQWWMTDYRGPATDEEAGTQARQRLDLMLEDLGALGVPVEGDLGSAQPMEAMEKVFIDRQFDEIIVATLPRPISRWLPADLPRKAERKFGLPVTIITTKR
jgi:GABA permease